MKTQPILIVDDNQSNLRLMEAVLDAEGYPVKSAMDAQEALALLEHWKPDLILMDIQMPGIDGLELTGRLKRDPRFKQIVVVALTAYAMKGDEQKALAAGCDGYLSKPIDTRTLPAAIEGYLKRAAPAMRPAAGKRSRPKAARHGRGQGGAGASEDSGPRKQAHHAHIHE